MHEKIKDLALAIALLGVGVFALIAIGATSEQSRIVSAATLNFASLPTIYAKVLIFLVGVYLLTIFIDIHKQRKTSQIQNNGRSSASEKEIETDQSSPTWSSRVIILRMIGTLLLLVLYVFCLEYIHFMIATTVFLFCMFYVFGQKSLKKITMVSIAGGAAFYLLFIKGLNLPI
jgi:Na+/melibiose symporter-like transporter